jgi:D-glycero-D-manno-heptose 1,7-bisphosphate phosphatase
VDAPLRPGVFLDRDGTIIEDAGYLCDPSGVVLLPGAGEAIGRMNRAGLPVIVVTNQSGIGRGLYGEEQFLATQRRVDELLAREGASLNGVYYCPHAPAAGCDCRKPRAELFRRAAAEHGLDPARSFFAGDRFRDVLPGIRLGGTGIIVGAEEALEKHPEVVRATTLADVADLAIGSTSRLT